LLSREQSSGNVDGIDRELNASLVLSSSTAFKSWEGKNEGKTFNSFLDAALAVVLVVGQMR
jgi:hypothetical protein